jgi:hypothetical protein
MTILEFFNNAMNIKTKGKRKNRKLKAKGRRDQIIDGEIKSRRIEKNSKLRKIHKSLSQNKDNKIFLKIYNKKGFD